jgi:LemA protein
MFQKLLRGGVVLWAVLGLIGCNYNDFQKLDDETSKAWSELFNQYQRRAELVPDLLTSVKAEASFEQATVTQVIEARAKVTSILVTPETVNDPETFQRFQAAQSQLGLALSRLMVMSEQYPLLQARKKFGDLRVQLQVTENSINKARNRYIQSVQAYNVLVSGLPSKLTAMAMGYKAKESFIVANEAQITLPTRINLSK